MTKENTKPTKKNQRLIMNKSKLHGTSTTEEVRKEKRARR